MALITIWHQLPRPVFCLNSIPYLYLNFIFLNVEHSCMVFINVLINYGVLDSIMIHVHSLCKSVYNLFFAVPLLYEPAT